MVIIFSPAHICPVVSSIHILHCFLLPASCAETDFFRRSLVCSDWTSPRLTSCRLKLSRRISSGWKPRSSDKICRLSIRPDTQLVRQMVHDVSCSRISLQIQLVYHETRQMTRAFPKTSIINQGIDFVDMSTVLEEYIACLRHPLDAWNRSYTSKWTQSLTLSVFRHSNIGELSSLRRGNNMKI